MEAAYRGALVALTVVVVTACSGGSKAQPTDAKHSAIAVEELGDSNIVAVEHPEAFPLVPVTTADVADRLRVTGVVSPDVNRTVPVNALGGGRVVTVKARLGDEVRKGQTLVIISSPDAGSAGGDYQKFRASESLARKQLERSRQLFEHGAIARKDLEIAEDAYERAKVDMTTAAARLRMMGGDLNRPTPLIEVRAPISGTIVEQNVAPASGVKSPDNAPNLFTIADLSRVWVLCDVYENELASVHTGALAEVRLNAVPDRVFRGTVGPISKVLDPGTRSAKVRVELENVGGVMRQGMFATVELISRARHNRMVVPATALIRLHDADWVFRKEAGNKFRRTQVRTAGTTTDGLQQILTGVVAGDQVVRNALEFSRSIEQE
ncbi:MAG: efflux RND transporter periplasmic adaptor subunit [Gemmatimonadaceae bacterium]